MRGIEVPAWVGGASGHQDVPGEASPPALSVAASLAASLMTRCTRGHAPRAGVVFPVDGVALAGAIHAHRAGVVSAELIGPRARMEEITACSHLSLDGVRVTDVPDERSALAAAAQAVREDRVDLLVKGSGHSGALLRAVLQCGSGSLPERRASHVFAMSVPRWPRLVFVTDAVVNIAPDLNEKADICRNAIDLARVLGVEQPNVAVLGAEEDVETSMPSTLHAAALAQMGRRGQLGRAVVDGPLALDDALDDGALALKGIDSPLGGHADVVVVPTIEAGNILYKGLIVLADATAAGLVVQTPVPVVLASRSDSVETRVASAALGSIWVNRATAGPGTA
jgi:phosphate acetyltransferase